MRLFSLDIRVELHTFGDDLFSIDDMKEAYLRGYYGYKNFGDEIIFFGIVKWIIDTHTVERLYVETEDPKRMHSWSEANAAFAR